MSELTRAIKLIIREANFTHVIEGESVNVEALLMEDECVLDVGKIMVIALTPNTKILVLGKKEESA